MAMTESVPLRVAARRAYEWGRWRYALRLVWVVLPLACAGLALGGAPEALGCLTVLLVGIGGWLRWRGGKAGASVLPGVLAGALPLAGAPLAANCCSVPLQGAVVLAMVAAISGAALALRAKKRGAGTLLISTAVALATACLSCTSSGGLMVLSAALGLVVGAAVFLLIRRAETQS